MSAKGITWTDKQKEIAAMLGEGKPQKEIIAAGHSKANISKVRAALKAAEKTREVEETVKETPETGKTPQETSTTYKKRILEAIEIGTIVIEPADWRINQYGAFLILTTYEGAKQKFNYEGTVGEFICDCVQLLRTVMGLQLMEFEYLMKEDGNGREETTASQGADISAESREQSVGKPEP